MSQTATSTINSTDNELTRGTTERKASRRILLRRPCQGSTRSPYPFLFIAFYC